MLSLNSVNKLNCMYVIRNLEDESVNCFLLDSPYMMGNKPFKNKAKKYKRVVEDWDNQWPTIKIYKKWCFDWICEMLHKLKLGGSVLIFGTFHSAFSIRSLLIEAGYDFRNFITWFKPNAMPVFMAKQMGVYAYSCEYINYFSKGKVAYFGYDYLKELNDGKQHRDLIIHNNRPHSESVGHPTQKPLGLIKMLVQAHCPQGGLVVDFFGGSGVLGISALRTGRNYILGEASAEYCDMIKLRLIKEDEWWVEAPDNWECNECNKPSTGILFPLSNELLDNNIGMYLCDNCLVKEYYND